MLKLKKQFREVSLKRVQDPEIWIEEFKDLHIKLERMWPLELLRISL
jgi:hypothetical protein